MLDKVALLEWLEGCFEGLSNNCEVDRAGTIHSEIYEIESGRFDCEGGRS